MPLLLAALALLLLVLCSFPSMLAGSLAGAVVGGVPAGGGAALVAPLPGAPVPVAGADWRALATSRLGLAYVWGGAGGRTDLSPGATAFDCSSFAAWLEWLGFGRRVVPQTQLAWDTTVPVARQDVRDGDLAFWNMWSSDPQVQHMAVVWDAQAGTVVQAGGRQDRVNIDSWNDIGSPTFRRAL